MYCSSLRSFEEGKAVLIIISIFINLFLITLPTSVLILSLGENTVVVDVVLTVPPKVFSSLVGKSVLFSL